MADATAPRVLPPGELSARGLDLRMLNVATTDLAAWSGALDEGERARAARFVRDEDRARFCLGRGLLRAMLGEALGRDPSALRFEPDAHGKPWLVDAPPGTPAFNLSHSGDWVLVALGAVARLGVDIEAHRADLVLAPLARLVFTPDEIRALADRAGTLVPAAFFRQWVLKEAVLKAIGTGLAADPRAIEIETRDGVATARFVGREGAEAPFAGEIAELAAPAGYSAALALAP